MDQVTHTHTLSLTTLEDRTINMPHGLGISHLTNQVQTFSLRDIIRPRHQLVAKCKHKSQQQNSIGA